MSPLWESDVPPAEFTPKPSDWPRILRRAVPVILMIAICLILLLLVRLIERPIWGLRRPITPFITQFVCRNAFRFMGIGFSTQGELMRERGAVVANHTTWLDIFSLNARKRIYFVSKAEVAGWPGIGWLARATGTVFIERDRKQAKAQTELLEQRLTVGHKLLFFPEGTSTDGLRVLPFKTTLFASFFSDQLHDFLHVQPVSVVYHAPKGHEDRFYGWWGDMELGPNLIKVLAVRKPGSVELIYHPPVKVSDFANRKALAAYCETVVRDGLEQALAD